MDANDDGVGDIRGIINKLDYIASLGVDAIWVSPFFKSPMKDFGYDISDYRDVDPLFGSLDDLDTLIAQAHERNIKVMIDQVLSHTSDQHAWFEESRASRDNPKSDWYVWADAKPDGTAPNNWISIFGGCGWEWEPRRGQYYLHNFLKSQPDLNFHNPDVQNQILSEVEFWLERGVDGLRLDAINFCFHDAQLRDNPAKPPEQRQGRGFSEDNPYAFQYHYYNNTQPENLAFLQRLRRLIDRFPGAVTLGEISSEDSLATMAEYTANNERLHMAYSFELLVPELCAKHIRDTVENLEASLGEGWPCWSLSNHDVVRVMSRWGGGYNPVLGKTLHALVASLRGSVCYYQGEELGLTEADIAYEDLQDPYGITFWPNFKGRDGCRTPMPWQSDVKNAGFSQVKPWLPVSDAHAALAVDVQEADANSMLNFYRGFMAWRKDQPLLLGGEIRFASAPEGCLLFERFHKADERQSLWVAFNLTDKAAQIPIPATLSMLDGHGLQGASLDDQVLTLPPYTGAFMR
ncbi:alpha glucosidase [Simiduia litorea]